MRSSSGSYDSLGAEPERPGWRGASSSHSSSGESSVDVEERPRHTEQPVVLAQDRRRRASGAELLDCEPLAPSGRAGARPSPRRVRSGPSSARRTARRASVRRPAPRSRPASTRAFPVVRPGTVRRCVRGPVRPSRASGRTTRSAPRRQRLLRYGFGSPPRREVKRAARRDRPSGRSRRHRVCDDPDQCASGRIRVHRSARIRAEDQREADAEPDPDLRPVDSGRASRSRPARRASIVKRSSHDGSA